MIATCVTSLTAHEISELQGQTSEINVNSNVYTWQLSNLYNPVCLLLLYSSASAVPLATICTVFTLNNFILTLKIVSQQSRHIRQTELHTQQTLALNMSNSGEKQYLFLLGCGIIELLSNCSIMNRNNFHSEETQDLG